MPWLPKTHVVVPVDFSDESIQAVDTALELVESPARVHAIHVLPILAATEPGVIWDTVDDAGRKEHAEQALQQRLAGERYAGIDIVVTIGDPGEEISDFAQSIQAELIVMPSHGRTGISRLLIGSVAERVMRLAHCPVLVLKS
ncbi:MAG: universal stress protein [Planctomycetales bacterium]|nr:universal stress protein [Planctomycetales bacterium]NIM08798.1 universal stress protein [Planctomycetales bacterium]NIN08263.1 universal stress protein [Planctomycetales bacterium]NIN77388.1 universal stress protein [Planctomycetales bacterium]NIO34225.1 universal stress protein [Planctomycetales bacterium]